MTTVRDAHGSLRTDTVRNFEARNRRARVVRQGEWFFLPITRGQRKNLEKGIVLAKTAIGFQPLGKPHVADERVVVGINEFIRGRVRHPDHKTVRFDDWVHVVRNTEDRRLATNWID